MAPHVYEQRPAARQQWVYWDVGFRLLGLLMVVIGRALVRRGKTDRPGTI
jgi:uncharacterized membrane protein